MGITVLNALMLASSLALVAIGLAIIFGLLGVINLAHGELFIIGGYTSFAVLSATGNVWLGLLIAPVVVAAVGVALDRALLRHLYQRPLDTLVVTWGLSIVLREVLKIIFGPATKNVAAGIRGQTSVLGLTYPSYRIFLIAACTVAICATLYVFARTPFGWRVRAVIQNREMAAAMGINTDRVDAAVFAIGAGLAGLAGALMAPLLALKPEVGLFFLARSFLVVIVGGVGSLLSAVGGAAVIGGGEGIISYFTRPILAQSLLFVLAILLIRIRPQGLFTRRGGR